MFIQHSSALNYFPKRIVSLVPSQTELLFDLGLDEAVVGITKFCVHPAAWRKTKTIAGGTKKPDIEKIKALKPDLIIANKEENIKEDIEKLAKDFPLWVTDVSSLDDTLVMIKDIGELTGTQAKATTIINRVKTCFTDIHSLRKKINTCYLIWQNPYMTVGGDTFIHDMMKHCGLSNIFTEEKRYPVISLEDLMERRCELLLLSSEPFPFKQKHLQELRMQLPSIKILLADGEYFSWYGSRLMQAPVYFNTIIDQLNS